MQNVPIPTAEGYDNAYLEAINSLAKDPRIPGPIFKGQKATKKLDS